MSETGPKIRAVLDTNLLVSGALTPTGVPGQVLRAWRDGAFALVMSPELAAEAADVLRRPTLTERFAMPSDVVDELLASLHAVAVPALPIDQLPVHCRDPKDDKVLACALGARADYLVTGDADLAALRDDPALVPLRIVSPANFLSLVEPKEQAA